MVLTPLKKDIEPNALQKISEDRLPQHSQKMQWQLPSVIKLFYMDGTSLVVEFWVMSF